jgi:transposase
MAARVAMSWNPHLADLAARIKAKGQPFKVQVTAVMRKLLVILNAIVASGLPCRMEKAGRGAQGSVPA